MNFSSALSDFNANVFRLAVPMYHTGNVVFSPFSLFTTLAMLLLGCKCDEETKDKLKTALSLASTTSDDALDSYVKSLMKGCSRNTDDHHLLVSNMLQVDEFNNLLNTVFFRSKWFQPFSPALKTFNYKNGTKKKVPFIFGNHFRIEAYPASTWTSPGSLRIIKVPYKDKSRISMFFFASSCYEVLESIISGSVSYWLRQFYRDSFLVLSLAVPKFSFAYEINMIDILNPMRLNKLAARFVDLSGINGHGEIIVGTIRHSTAITIDEEDTEVSIPKEGKRLNSNVSPSANVTLDRPFLFVIYDEEAKVPLFAGKVDEPISL